MKTKEALLEKLRQYEDLMDIIVRKRKWKVIIRLLLSVPFYYFLWHITWIRYMFWISMPLEIVMLLLTIFFYFRLRDKIQETENELMGIA